MVTLIVMQVMMMNAGVGGMVVSVRVMLLLVLLSFFIGFSWLATVSSYCIQRVSSALWHWKKKWTPHMGDSIVRFVLVVASRWRRWLCVGCVA